MSLSYSEKIKNVREYLGKTQAEFADLLGISQVHVSRIENPDSSKRLKRSREAILIKVANLPSNYFDDDIIVDKITNDELFYTLIPEAKEAGLTLQDIRDMLKPLANRRSCNK